MSSDFLTTALTSSTATATSAATGKSTLGKDDFLKLLIVQLRNQDPLDPMKGTEFATQLAQFSSVEQLSNINTNLTDSIAANQLMTQSIGNSLAATMIGKDIKASASSFTLTGSNTVNIGYTLGNNAATVDVKVYDSAGTLVRTIKAVNTEKGDGSVAWDGKNDNGSQAAAGTYSVKVDAVDLAGTAVTATSFMTGTVTGVRFTANGTVFVVDGVEVPLSQIIEVLNGKGNG
jgi:flagellar basal-body rod modification protein FlgD